MRPIRFLAPIAALLLVLAGPAFAQDSAATSGGQPVICTNCTGSSGSPTNVQGTGVAGTPAGGVLTVQPPASGGTNFPTVPTTAQGSTTAGTAGNLILGTVNTSPPSAVYGADNGLSEPLQIGQHGALRVEQANWTGTGSLSTASVATSSSSGSTITTASSTWTVGQAVTLTGTVGTTLTVGNIYYIVGGNGTTTIQIAASPGGTAITPSASLTSAFVWNALVIPISDAQGTLAFQAVYSGGSATMNFAVGLDGTTFTPINFLTVLGGTLGNTISATSYGKFSVAGWNYLVMYVNANSAADTITVKWGSAATPTTTSLTSPLPNGGNNIGSVQSNPGARTIVPLDVATVTTGGVAVTALSAGHRTAGGWLYNPIGATINLCINEQGTASGTTSAGALTCIQPGQSYTLTPAAGAVSVITSDSAHPFSGQGLN